MSTKIVLSTREEIALSELLIQYRVFPIFMQLGITIFFGIFAWQMWKYYETNGTELELSGAAAYCGLGLLCFGALKLVLENAMRASSPKMVEGLQH